MPLLRDTLWDQTHIAQAFAEGTPIDEAMNQAVRNAIRLHQRMGLPLAVWRDGTTVWVNPEAVPTEIESEDSHSS